MIRLGCAPTYPSSMISSFRGSFWFHCPNKSTHELALHLRGDGIHINALPDQKRPCVLNVVNSGGLNIDGLKSSLRELVVIFRISEGTRNAPNPQQHVAPDDGRHLTPSDHIGHSKTATRFQYSKCLAQNTIFVARQIDDAVGDDDIDRGDPQHELPAGLTRNAA